MAAAAAFSLSWPKTASFLNVGIRIGDMGEKNGLNGVDNGFMMFDRHFVPREALLNKQGDVSREGR